jgi:hypothetical protein
MATNTNLGILLKRGDGGWTRQRRPCASHVKGHHTTARSSIAERGNINFNRNNSLTLSVTVRKLLVSSAGVSRLYTWARLFDWPQLSTRSARDALYGLTARSIIPVSSFFFFFQIPFFFNSFLSLLMESNHPETVWPPAEYPVPPTKQCAPTTIHTCIG